MTNLATSEGQAAQPNSAQSDDYRGARQLQKLKKRLRRRIRRLRILAYVFFALAILVLVGGAAVFGYANYIARLTLSPPQTASAQYDMATAAKKRLSEQQAALNDQRKEILNEAVITRPENEKIEKVKAEYGVLEDDILQHCPKKTLNKCLEDCGIWLNGAYTLTVTSSGFDNYVFSLPSGRSVSFEGLDLANDCKNHFEEHREEIIRYAKRWVEILNEKSEMLAENSKSKSEKLAPIYNLSKEISDKNQDLDNLIKYLKIPADQEKYLGITVTPEKQPSDNADAKIDWPHVIETNATRIGVLAAMFFLVTILVPQYRYSIKMANFYQARSDSLEMLPDQMSAEDLDKIVSIMTPSIDFGKSPPTPWEHILEVMKAAKS